MSGIRHYVNSGASAAMVFMAPTVQLRLSLCFLLHGNHATIESMPDQRARKVAFTAHCLLNQNAKVDGMAQEIALTSNTRLPRS